MSSSNAANEPSPRKAYRLMAIVAVAILGLLSLAIFSLSRLETSPWSRPLAKLQLQNTFRKNLPQFEFDDGEKRLSPQNLVGKWTLLSFWSYSCPPCLEELPSLNQLALNWSGPEMEVLTVNVDAEKSEYLESAKSFLKDQEIVLPTLFDKRGILVRAFGVTVFPKHFLINPEGQMIWEGQGAYDWNGSSARDQLLKLTEQQTPESTQDPAE